MLKGKFARILAPIALLMFTGTASAQIATFDVSGGVSFPTGKSFNDWDAGFVVSTNDFVWLSDDIGVGIRGAFNRWAPDNAHFNQTIWEVIPSMRVRTNFSGSPINFFGQGGFGLYITKSENTSFGTGTPVFTEGSWIGRWGFSAGPGITIGMKQPWALEIFPLYNLVFTGFQGNTIYYFTVNAGISVNF